MSEQPGLERLAEEIAGLFGVEPAYTDAFGRRRESPLSSRRALLAALGLPTATFEEARASLARVIALKQGPLPALIPVLADAPARLPIRRSAQGGGGWTLVTEAGETLSGQAESGGFEADRIVLPPLAAGYHRLSLAVGDASSVDATVIAAPARCWVPEPLASGRLWGVTAPVYALRSERDFGMGDYSVLAEAAAGAARHGAEFFGFTPVHALFGADRSKISPYSPSSRLFLETAFIDPTAVEGFAGSPAAAMFAGEEVQAKLAALRILPLADMAAVWKLKRPLLDALWAGVRENRSAEFEEFRTAGGAALEAHATFEALSEHFSERGRAWMGEWDVGFREAGSLAVRGFRDAHPDRVAFHAWLQFLADRQLGEAARRAQEAGMSLGLYRDLAVGADIGGSEVWSAPDRFVPGVSIGAPPDPLAPQGQLWGLPPLNPLVLEADGLAGFRALIRANLRHAAALRIDHAFQLRRLFLTPDGESAADGAYVDYPFDAMLAVLRIESHRARALIIAEDLGTAPEGFSDAIMQSGVLSYRVLYFERGDEGRFKRPSEYPRDAVAVINTHDLPTFTGWWRSRDIDWRARLGIYDPMTAGRQYAARGFERGQLLALADEEKLREPGADQPEAPFSEVLRLLARSRSALVAVQLEDAAGEVEQTNVPGTTDAHPNWRRRIGKTVADLTAAGGPVERIGLIMIEEGRG